MILDTAAALVAKHGLRAVTMSQIAETAGIGRATLYKYFSGVEAILVAWHERQVSRHLHELMQIRDRTGDPKARLDAVLEAYARIAHTYHGTALAALVHHREHAVQAQQQLTEVIRDLLAEAAAVGVVRGDVPPDELAIYCVHALAAASSLRSEDAVRRLLGVIHAGLRRSR